MKLKAWLEANEISQCSLARQLGMSRTHIHVVANGKIKPGRRFVDVIFAFTEGAVTPEDMGMKEYVPNKIVIVKPGKHVVEL